MAVEEEVRDLELIDADAGQLIMQLIDNEIGHFEISVENVVEFKILVVGPEWKHQVFAHFQPSDVEYELQYCEQRHVSEIVDSSLISSLIHPTRVFYSFCKPLVTVVSLPIAIQFLLFLHCAIKKSNGQD